jgi:hypothetical protein
MHNQAMRTLVLATLTLALLHGAVRAPALAQPDESVRTWESARYRLDTDAPEDTAREYLKMLEAAWPLMEQFFGQAPKLRKDEKLRISFRQTQQGWHQALQADKVDIPVGAGGYYWPGNRTVYLWKQPTIYNTRQLLLHEAMHQFHFLACCNNVGPKDTWYVEGVVEHLSRHYWDGETLTLGVVPLCSLENYPRLALELFERQDFSLADMIDDKRASTRPEQWALVRYLLLGDDGKLKPRWDKLRPKLDAGQPGKTLFRPGIGDPAALQPKIRQWLKTQQEPLVPVWNEWWGLGPDSARGTATVTSALRAREDAVLFSATLNMPAQGAYKGGLLIGFEDAGHYAVALFDSGGGFSVNLRKDETWHVLKRGRTAPPKTEGRLQLRAERVEGGIRVVQDDVETGVFDLPGRKLGVCLENCTLSFTDLKWK